MYLYQELQLQQLSIRYWSELLIAVIFFQNIDPHFCTHIHGRPPKTLRYVLRLTLLTVDPLLTKWQMGCRGFLTSTSKQRRAGTPWKPGHNQSFHPAQFYSSGGHTVLAWEESVSERWLQRLVFGKNIVGEKTVEALLSSFTLTPWSVSVSLPFILSLSLFCTGLFCCPPSTHSSSVVMAFILSSNPSLSLAYPSSFSIWSGLVYPAPPSSLISLPHVSLPPLLPFFMSFWPQSHFPNWLSGSLIILRHPCCRLFYLSACRRSNPVISK